MRVEHIEMVYRILTHYIRPEIIGVMDQDALLRGVEDYRRLIALAATTEPDTLVSGNITELLDAVPDTAVERYSRVWTLKDTRREFIVAGDQWLLVQCVDPCTVRMDHAGGPAESRESIAMPHTQRHAVFFRTHR